MEVTRTKIDGDSLRVRQLKAQQLLDPIKALGAVHRESIAAPCASPVAGGATCLEPTPIMMP